MDGAALMRGMRVLVLSLAAVALGVMPLTLLPSRWAVYAAMFLLPLVGAIAFGAGTYFMVALVRFMRRKPTVCIDAAMDEGHVRIECWETPDRRKDLDALLETVQKLQKKVDDLVPYPAEVSFHLFHMRPLRVHLLQATAITLILLLPVRWLAEYAQLPFLYLFLLLPFVWYLGMHAIEKLQMMAEPKLFREAVADYEMERLHEASLKLRSLLATQPDHLPGLILRAQTATLQGDFRSAFECCDRIDPIDDDLSDSLRDEILAIERLHKRMGE